MALWHSTQVLDGSDNWAKARQLQGLASLAEAELLSGGVAGLKYLLCEKFGYPAAPRLPLQPMSDFEANRLSTSTYLKRISN
ncbi:hypothetical protein LTR84_003607 [Exophiala bonariae]|uniref:Uncharacterized protein n=1 Tax=Exophiala bonariae TaxID=1690606 RepID=A0AAV9N7T3_9EURO|nr:hypothetical protein LTR84_003607 [Exophiala bonariae]